MTKPEIVVGPEPYLATCRTCGAAFPKPELPIPMVEFLRLIRLIGTTHRVCTPRGD